MKIKYIGLLILVLWLITVLGLVNWFETIPIEAQEKGEYLTVYREPNPSPDVSVEFLQNLLLLLEEYKVYADTLTWTSIRVVHDCIDLNTGQIISDTSRTTEKGTFMSIEGLLEWLRDVKLKELEKGRF